MVFSVLAIKKLGPACRVIFCDISESLLEHCKETAKKLQVINQCKFICANTTDLSQIKDITIDAVTIRSVLIYVNDKSQAFREYHRILKPNGRLSIFEPVHRWFYPGYEHFFGEYNLKPVLPIYMKIKENLKNQEIGNDPMLNFNEHDLLEFASSAGFTDINLDINIHIKRSERMNWISYLNIKPNPKALSPGEIIDKLLTNTEKKEFFSYLKPIVERGEGIERAAMVYLTAKKI